MTSGTPKPKPTERCGRPGCGHEKLVHGGSRCVVAGCYCPRFVWVKFPRRRTRAIDTRRPGANDVRLFDPDR